MFHASDLLFCLYEMRFPSSGLQQGFIRVFMGGFRNYLL